MRARAGCFVQVERDDARMQPGNDFTPVRYIPPNVQTAIKRPFPENLL